MSKLEYAIRQGNFKKEKVIIDGIWTGEYTYIVRINGSKFDYNERISESYYQAINDRIRRADFRRSVSNYTPEHSAVLSDIMAAYNDYKMAMAY